MPKRHDPPSDISQSFIVARYELLKHLRSRRLIGIGVVLVAVLALITAIPPAFGDDYSNDPADFAGSYIGFVTLLVIISATLFASDAIVSDFEKRTGYLIFPNPVKKWSIFAGKFFATMIITTVALGFYYLVVAMLSLAITGEVSGLMGLSFVYAILYVLAASSLGFLMSSLFKSSTSALVLTIVLLLLLLPIVDSTVQLAEIEPNYSLTYNSDVVSYIMDDPYPEDIIIENFTNPFTGDPFVQYVPDPGMAAGVMLTYSAVLLSLAMMLFYRRQMKD